MIGFPATQETDPSIYSAAEAITPPPSPPATTTTGFHPINPDGALTNCIPPDCLSPLGPVAYLSELLQVAESSTCAEPLAPSVKLTTNGDTQSGVTLPFASTAGVSAGMYVSATNIPGNTTSIVLKARMRRSVCCNRFWRMRTEL